MVEKKMYDERKPYLLDTCVIRFISIPQPLRNFVFSETIFSAVPVKVDSFSLYFIRNICDLSIKSQINKETVPSVSNY